MMIYRKAVKIFHNNFFREHLTKNWYISRKFRANGVKRLVCQSWKHASAPVQNGRYAEQQNNFLCFNNMRRSFLNPIPQIEIAISYLDEAVNYLLANDLTRASDKIIKADIKEIAEYYKLIAGKTSFPIHWQHHQPTSIPKEKRIETRMPSLKEQENIFKRDGWRCRFCGTRVLSRRARKKIIEMFPNETHWVPQEYERHTALHSQAASLDHILPHSRGGNNSENNLVTACGPCQFGRNQWTIEEVGFSDPRQFQPVNDGWDGLTRIAKIIT